MQPIQMQSPFVCRLCTGLPRFRTYSALRAHLRIFHGRRDLSHVELGMFEIHPGSRYNTPEFQRQLPNAGNEGAMALAVPLHAMNQGNVPASVQESRKIPVDASGGDLHEAARMPSVNLDTSQKSLTLTEVENMFKEHFNRGFDAIEQMLTDQHQNLLMNMQQLIADNVENGVKNALRELAGSPNVSIGAVETPDQLNANIINDGLNVSVTAGVEDDKHEKSSDCIGSPTKSDEELMNVSMNEQVDVSVVLEMMEVAQNEENAEDVPGVNTESANPEV